MNGPYRHHIERRASRRPARQYVSDTHDHKPVATNQAVKRCLRLLRSGNIVLSAGVWRFGMAAIGDNVIAQVIADGRAVREGNTVSLARG